MTSSPDPHTVTPAHGAVPPRRRIGVFVLVDGLGYELVRETDFLPEFELRVGLRSVIGAPESAHATLLTGRTVREHGIEGPLVPAATHGSSDDPPWWTRLPGVLHHLPGTRARALSATGVDPGRWPTLAAHPTRLLPRLRAPHGGEMFAENEFGGCPNVFRRLAGWGIRHAVLSGDVPQSLSLELASTQLREAGCELVFLRLPQLGQQMRRIGTGHALVREELDSLTRSLHRLHEEAESLVQEVEFFVFGDQAVLDVHGYTDLGSFVREGVPGRRREILALYHPTHARIWSPDAATHEQVQAVLEQTGQGRVVPDDELHELGWPPLGPSRSCFFALDAGLAIHPNFADFARPAAAAGYHPDLPQSLVAMLGNFSPSLDVSELRGMNDLIEATAGRILQDRA